MNSDVISRGSGVGDNEKTSSAALFSELFSIVKHALAIEGYSRLYLTGVATDQLQWHL